MKGAFLAAFGIGVVTSACVAADKAEVEKERTKFQGTWQLRLGGDGWQEAR